MMSQEREELVEMVKGEIAHNISPVIGWLRYDASIGRDDADKKNLQAYRERLDKAAADVVALIERLGF